MADEGWYAKIKKRYTDKDGKMNVPVLANPPPLPGPAGIGRAAIGTAVQAGIRTMKNLSNKGSKVTKPKGKRVNPKRYNVTNGKIGIASEGSSVPALRPVTRPPARTDNGGSRALVKRENNLPAKTGGASAARSNSVPALRPPVNRSSSTVSLTPATRATIAGKSGAGVGAVPVPSVSAPKGAAEEKKKRTFSDKGIRKATNSYSKAVPKPKAKPDDIKEPKLPNLDVGAKKKASDFRAKMQGRKKTGISRADKQKPKFYGNWVGAAPTEMQARGGVRMTRQRQRELMRQRMSGK